VAKFTQAEKDCISAKIKILRSEGKDMDQAIAVAISECAPEKSTSKMAACCPECKPGEPCTSKGEASPSGYAFQRLPSGMFRVMNVPVMAEVPKGKKQNRNRIGPGWLKAAVRRAKLRWKQDRYKAPLHVEHHGSGSSTEPAGFIMPHSVKRMTYEGKPVWAVYADLEVQPKILQKIQARELPFRSVEIFDWSQPEINSCALLRSEVPFFRFDLLELGEEVEGGPEKFAETIPIDGCRAFARGSAVLFSFRDKDQDMATKLESRAERADVDRYEYEEGKQAGEREEEEKLAARLEEIEEEEEDKEKIEMQELPALDLAPVLEMLQKIADALGVGAVEEIEDVEEVSEAEVAMPPVEQEALAALSGKVIALEARERHRKREERGARMVDAAMEELAPWSPDAETRSNLQALVHASNSPRETVKTFVRTYKSAVPRYPVSTLAEFEAGQHESDDPSVLKFAADGADALGLARGYSRQYDELQARGMINTERDEFIRIQMDAATSGTIAKR